MPWKAIGDLSQTVDDSHVGEDWGLRSERFLLKPLQLFRDILLWVKINKAISEGSVDLNEDLFYF